MTRTYARETVTFTQAEIDSLVADGRAQYFPGLPGYVIDRKQAVRMHQIVADDNAAEAELADAENVIYHPYLVQAEQYGISVDELTDGEYTVVDGKVVSRLDELDRPSGRSAMFRKFDDILSDFGV